MSGEDSDGNFELTQRGLFVQHPTRPIDLDTVPLDGNEFIHKSKLEEILVSCTQMEDLTIVASQKKKQIHVGQHAMRYAEKFSKYAQILANERDFLKKKFPRKVKIPDLCIKDWCLFCLGSRLYSKIYGAEWPFEEPSDEVGHLPVLSIIVHLKQHHVKMILSFLYDWFLKLGMEESLGMWVYALLACLEKPLHKDTERLLEHFYKSCILCLKESDADELSPLYRISAILEHYFRFNSM